MTSIMSGDVNELCEKFQKRVYSILGSNPLTIPLQIENY